MCYKLDVAKATAKQTKWLGKLVKSDSDNCYLIDLTDKKTRQYASDLAKLCFVNHPDVEILYTKESHKKMDMSVKIA